MAGPPPPAFNSVKAQVFDPSDTDSAAAAWVNGLGCPNATATQNTNNSNGNFTDPACSSGYDTKDEENAGLLLAKDVTTELSAGQATLGGIAPNSQVTELGYDIRTVHYPNSLSSHCGAGAPRFDVTTTTGSWFVGCSSPQADTVSSDTPGSGGWTRLRWGNGTAGSVQGFPTTGGGPTAITGTVKSIAVVFDEGADTGPDNFGAAVLDNIDFNSAIVGRG